MDTPHLEDNPAASKQTKTQKDVVHPEISCSTLKSISKDTDPKDTDRFSNYLASLTAEFKETREQLAAMLADSCCFKQVLAWRGQKAQLLINLLQTVIFYPYPQCDYLTNL